MLTLRRLCPVRREYRYEKHIHVYRVVHTMLRHNELDSAFYKARQRTWALYEIHGFTWLSCEARRCHNGRKRCRRAPIGCRSEKECRSLRRCNEARVRTSPNRAVIDRSMALRRRCSSTMTRSSNSLRSTVRMSSRETTVRESFTIEHEGQHRVLLLLELSWIYDVSSYRKVLFTIVSYAHTRICRRNRCVSQIG